MPSRTALDAYELAQSAVNQIEGHEEICAVRHKTINDKLDDLKSMVRWGARGVMALTVSLIGFLGHEAYSNIQHPQPAAQVVVK